MAQLRNTNINDTGNFTLPSGTTAQRPASPITGMMRYNTTLSETEYYDGTAWRILSDSNPIASGGTVTDTVIAGVPYRIHTFTTIGNSTFTVTKGGEVDYLIVAGGGGGRNRHAGGGGAGGVLTGTTTVTPQSYTITVGAGGVGNATNYPYGGSNTTTSGSNSSAVGLTAIGGGASGVSGGSGGGGGAGANGAGGTSGQGNSGGSGSYVGGGFTAESSYAGGGGGGAGGPGVAATTTTPSVVGDGGQGILSLISGEPKYYAGGGGGGGAASAVRGGYGGHGGGGNGGPFYSGRLSSDGAPNTGGGGGSGAFAGSTNYYSGAGGSGIVILRYRRNESVAPGTSIVSSTSNSSPTEFLVQEGLVLNLDASNPESYAGFGTTTYSSQGTTWRNLADDANNGTITGDLPFERGAPNHGTFNFTNSPYVSTSNIRLGNGNIAWALNAWVRTTTTADALGHGAVASNASGGPVYSSIGVNAGKISYWTYEGQWLRRIGNRTVNDGAWHMLTWVNYTNSTMAMYVDGEVDVDNQRSVSGNNNPIDRFGGSWTARFDGRISKITINLNRVLTSAEIQQTFNATRWRFGV